MTAELDQLLAQGQLKAAAQLVERLLNEHAGDAQLWRTSGLIALHLGQLDAAMAALNQATSLAPEIGSLWADYGAVLEVAGRFQEAEAALHRALRIDPNESRHRLKLAAVLVSTGKHAEAAMLARQVVAKDSRSLAGWHVLADTAYAQSHWQAALRSYERALELAPSDAKLHFNAGLCHLHLQQLVESAAAFAKALKLDAKLYPALSQWLFVKRKLCDWNGIEPAAQRLRELVRLGVTGITPFSFLAEPATAHEQLLCARSEARHQLRALGLTEQPSATRRATRRPGPVRVGFVSNGFGQHPTGLLTVQLIESFDRRRVLPFLFATAPGDGGPIRARLAGAAELISDLSYVPPQVAARRISECAIDVLVDLRGYGDGGVPAVFALKPAPISVNWLAFPGTSGAPWHDYLIADPVVLPPALRANFSESIVWLKHCFQPYDGKTQIAKARSRAAYGLPERGFVFASFNNSYKFSAACFGIWCEILRTVADSHLWLMASAPHAEVSANLRREAAMRGIAAERLVFFEKRAHADYLAAYQHADLFLDTWPYGAHTTARDALFAGCPLLTLVGQTFAARVGASLNHYLGTDALNCPDEESYLHTAIGLSQNPTLLGEMRAAVHSGHAKLFDSAGFASGFTDALERIHARWLSGAPAQDLDLSQCAR